ncbi:MAG: efflux transporter outer membrane subunit [Methylomonas sp.]|nr:efflux transporter outer membrane subunit [Methylomonas sp.]
MSRMRRLKRDCLMSCVLLALEAGLQGCSYFSPAETLPATVPVPETWSATRSVPEASVRPWLSEIGDSELQALVEEALSRNPAIRSLIAGVAVADDQAWLDWSAFWPQLTGGFRSSRNQRNNAAGFAVSPRPVNNFGFNLDFLWEIDLWYRLGNELEASLHEKTAAEADLQAARLSLAANIAKTWFDAITARQLLSLAERTIENYGRTLEIVEQGYDKGLYQALDLRLARQNVLSAQQRRENVLRSLDETTRSLESLLGRYPGADLKTPEQLPVFDKPLPDSVPAGLLRRRPDIVAAGERFRATDQRLLKARKNMLPTIQLTGSVGTSTKKLEEVFNPENLIWNLAGSLTQPLFHGGQLFAERSQAEGRVEKAAADYAQVVLQAFKEVETALAAEQRYKNQEALLRAEVVEAKEAERLAELDYLSGLIDIVTLLEAQRRALDAESSRLDMSRQYLHNRINLYLALGGPVLESDEL